METLVVCISLVVVSVMCQSQQYDTPESSGGNIFTGRLNHDNSIPGQQGMENSCTFRFTVPTAMVQGLGCVSQGKSCGGDNMESIQETIIQLEERMINRDNHRKMQIKKLYELFQREHVFGATTKGFDGTSINDNMKVKMGGVEHEIQELKTMVTQLRRQVRYLEEQVRSAGPTPDSEVKQHIREGNCPPKYERHNNSCYGYYRDKRTWYKSKDFCENLGGHLLSIETEGEQDFIKGFLKDKGVRRDSFWVYAGGNDLDNDKTWTWIGSNHVIRHPEFWYSDVTPPPDTGFVCMFLYLWDPNDFAKWTKDRCDFLMPSICELPLVYSDL